MAFSRRDLLRFSGSATAIGFAGCLDFGCTYTANFTLVPASSRELIEQLTIPESRLGQPDQRLVRSAIDGETTYRDCNLRVRDGIYVVEGTYYRLTSSVSRREQATMYTINLDSQPPDTPTDETSDQIISFEMLPQIDQQALAGVLSDLTDGDDPNDIGGSGPMCYPTERTEDSVLIPTSEYRFLRYDGMRVKFSIEKREDVNDSIKTFHVRAKEIASSSKTFAQYAYQRILSDVVDLDEKSLSQKQEAILNRAIKREDDTGVSTCVDNPSSEFEELIRMIFDINEDLTTFVPEESKPVIWTEQRYFANYILSAP